MAQPKPGATPKQSRTARVLDLLRRDILTGRLAPGEKVNLERLRADHGLSLSPVREALSRLIAEHLVEFQDLRGYRIAPISAKNLVEVTQLRADTEALALGYAMSRAGLDWESGIPAALHRLTRAGAREDRATTHAAFHDALIAGCGMPMLRQFAGVLGNLHRRYRNLLGPPFPQRDLAAEHAAIAEATLARDADLAQALLRGHVERTGAELQDRLGG